MKMSGEYRISAPRQFVWDALNDPAILKNCLPGCEKFENTSDSVFDAIITTKVGLVKMTFASSIELSEIDPPNAYTISGEGKGGAAGFAKGSAKVRLTEHDDVTTLIYTVDARLGGKLAQMGSRVIDGVAKKMADDFFGQLADTVSAASDADVETASTAKAPTRERTPRVLWYVVVVGVVAFVILGAVFLGGGR